MNQKVKVKWATSSGITPALWVELQKIRRSKILWISFVAFSFLTLICGLFMFILKDPDLARRLGLLGTKAEIFGGSADWPNLFNLALVLMNTGGLVIFSFIFVWIFGHEFGDKTIYDFLSLPTSRVTIVIAKIITAVYWSMSLILLEFTLTLCIGAILQLPGWSAATVLSGFEHMIVTGLLTGLLAIPFALVASVTRGYLPAVGCIFLALLLGQVFSTLGYGQYFPWDIPLLYSGAAEALTGDAATDPNVISYILVGLISIMSFITLGVWWRYADQT